MSARMRWVMGILVVRWVLILVLSKVF